MIHLVRTVGMPTINVALFLDLCTPREAVLALIEFRCRVPNQSSKLRINCAIRHLCLVTRGRQVRPEEKRKPGNGSIWSLTVGGYPSQTYEACTSTLLAYEQVASDLR